ncbi:hypothetical protein AAVH_04758 [Aphelenchoides avenae]|nr:hypothetical protein AAVH_04758 [Aphelenchus avenae]
MYGYTQQNAANQFGTFNSSYGLTSATQNQPTMNSFGQAALGSLGASALGSSAGGYNARDFGAAAGTQFPYSNVSSGYSQYGSQQASAAAGYGPQPSIDTYNTSDYGAAFKAATSNASANSYLGLNRISGMGATGYGSGLGATNALGSKPQTAASGGQYGISNYDALFAAANAAVASNYMNHSQPKPITAASQWSRAEEVRRYGCTIG